VKDRRDSLLPEHDRIGLQSFLTEWTAASPAKKALILGRKLLFLVFLLGVILAAREIIKG